MKRGVKEHSNGVVLRNAEVMKEIESGYKYFGVLEGVGIINNEKTEKGRSILER